MHPYGPQSQSVNFVQHKRFDDALINPEHMIKPRMPKTNQSLDSTLQQQQPTVGDGAPKHKLLQASTTSSSSSTSSGGGGGDINASKQSTDTRRTRHTQQKEGKKSSIV